MTEGARAAIMDPVMTISTMFASETSTLGLLTQLIFFARTGRFSIWERCKDKMSGSM